MAVTIVQESQAFIPGPATSLAATFGSATSTGSLLVATFYVESDTNISANITGITDAAGNGWFQVPSARGIYATSNALTTDIWYCSSAKSGATTITATTDINCVSSIIFIHEYSVSGKVGAVDTAGNTSQSANMTGPSLTISQTQEILLAINHPVSVGQSGVNSPWVLTAPSIAFSGAFEAQILNPSSTGSYQATFTPGDSGCISSAAFLFQNASGNATVITGFGNLTSAG